MMWASVVPAAMIQPPPCMGLSGRPIDSLVAFGTAIVVCFRAVSASGPFTLIQVDPNSGSTRVPVGLVLIQYGLAVFVLEQCPPGLRQPVEVAHVGATAPRTPPVRARPIGRSRRVGSCLP